MGKSEKENLHLMTHPAYFERTLFIDHNSAQKSETTMSASSNPISEEDRRTILPPTLYRLTEALPKTELDVIIREARARDFVRLQGGVV